MSKREELVEQLHAADQRLGLDEPLARPFLHEVVNVIERYARLEKMVLGSVKVSYSSASLETDLKLPGDPIAQGERLADAERKVLSLQAGPILELGFLIEDQGIKIIPRVFPESSGALGGFFFDGDLGPSILINLRANASEIDYTLARHYGHFLADYDPYVTIISGRTQPESLHEPIQIRAHQFALAFLMPREDLETYRSAMNVTDDDEIPFELVQQLQVYFNLDPEIVIWRLLSLGWLDQQSLQKLLSQEAARGVELRSKPVEQPQQAVLPERFIRFVASAFGLGKLEVEDAARFLGTDLEEASGILGQFKFEDSKPKRGNGASKART